MLYPSINLLRQKVDSKYTLVSMASKRARDIIDGKPIFVEGSINKPVSIATEEIAQDQITYSRSFSTEQEALAIEHELHMSAAGYTTDGYGDEDYAEDGDYGDAAYDAEYDDSYEAEAEEISDEAEENPEDVIPEE